MSGIKVLYIKSRRYKINYMGEDHNVVILNLLLFGTNIFSAFPITPHKYPLI